MLWLCSARSRNSPRLGHISLVAQKVYSKSVIKFPNCVDKNEGTEALENYHMPVPQPARNPVTDVLSDDPHLQERFELITKKYSLGLQPHEVKRLAEIEELLDQQDFAKADQMEAQGNERMRRIEATLDRVEQAIRDLKTAKPQ